MAQNILINNYSTRNIFVWNNRFNTGTYTNGTGSTVNLTAGMLIGRVAATGLLKQSISSATDGSQRPIGVLTIDYEVANGDSVTINYCYSGDIDAGMLVFGGSPTDSLTTVVSLTDSGSDTVKIGTIGDLLRESGINPIATTENTYADNQ